MISSFMGGAYVLEKIARTWVDNIRDKQNKKKRLQILTEFILLFLNLHILVYL